MTLRSAAEWCLVVFWFGLTIEQIRSALRYNRSWKKLDREIDEIDDFMRRWKGEHRP